MTTKTKPKASVIIPTYNRDMFIERAINCVLNQTYMDLEVVVVDDESTDNTREIVNGINDDRVKYFYKKNGGCSSARNYGIKHSKGEYVAFLDSDDLWDPAKLEKQVAVLESEKDCEVVCSRAKAVNKDGEVLSYLPCPVPMNVCSNMLYELVCCDGGSEIRFQTTLIRKETLERFGPLDDTMSTMSDMAFILRLATTCNFYMVNEFLYFYFIHDEGQLVNSSSGAFYKNYKYLVDGFTGEFSGKIDNKYIKLLKSKYNYQIGRARVRFGDGSFFMTYKNFLKAFFYNYKNYKSLPYLLNPFKIIRQRSKYAKLNQ